MSTAESDFLFPFFRVDSFKSASCEGMLRSKRSWRTKPRALLPSTGQDAHQVSSVTQDQPQQ